MGKYHKRKSSAGKGDLARSNWSPQFRSNYDSIDWSKKSSVKSDQKKPTKT